MGGFSSRAQRSSESKVPDKKDSQGHPKSAHSASSEGNKDKTGHARSRNSRQAGDENDAIKDTNREQNSAHQAKASVPSIKQTTAPGPRPEAALNSQRPSGRHESKTSGTEDVPSFYGSQTLRRPPVTRSTQDSGSAMPRYSRPVVQRAESEEECRDMLDGIERTVSEEAIMMTALLEAASSAWESSLYLADLPASTEEKAAETVTNAQEEKTKNESVEVQAGLGPDILAEAEQLVPADASDTDDLSHSRTLQPPELPQQEMTGPRSLEVQVVSTR